MRSRCSLTISGRKRRARSLCSFRENKEGIDTSVLIYCNFLLLMTQCTSCFTPATCASLFSSTNEDVFNFQLLCVMYNNIIDILKCKTNFL